MAIAADRQIYWTQIEIGLLVGTLALSGLAAWAAVCAVRVTKDTAQKQLRAYMTVQSFDIQEIEGSDKEFFVATLANTGATPALNVRGQIRVTSIRTDQMATLDFNKESERGHSVDNIGAGGIYRKSIASVIQRMTPPHIVEEGHIALFVYGYVHYRDFFGKDHTTRFRYQWGGLSDVAASRGFVVSPEGNTMD